MIPRHLFVHPIIGNSIKFYYAAAQIRLSAHLWLAFANVHLVRLNSQVRPTPELYMN